MPKMKTHRGAAKRFRVTTSGKVRYKRSNARHMLTAKSRARKRKMRTPGELSSKVERGVKRLLGVG